MEETKKNTRFKKGQIANPKGRKVGTRLVPPEIKQFNAQLIAKAMQKYITMSVEELNEVIKDSKIPVLDMIIARILATGIQKSDQARFNFILERMVGKVPDKIDHSSTDGSMTPTSLRIEFVDNEISQLE